MPAKRRSLRRKPGRRSASLSVLAVLAVVGLGLLIDGCGGSSGSTASRRAHATSRLQGAAGAATVTTVTGRDGTYLVDGSGRALYMWVGDSPDKSNCTGDCALSWPPLTASAAPKVAGGAAAADVGTIRRADGSRQVTYKGHPLYRFVVDSGPGTTKGQGSSSFGARWWLVAPSGSAITVNGGSSVSPPISY
jgi:predicted lipoprotein with Yx(FWY)xxD motif